MPMNMKQLCSGVAGVVPVEDVSGKILRVSDQNGVSPLYIMLEIHRSGREPLIGMFSCVC